MSFKPRKARIEDKIEILNLYKKVSEKIGGIARTQNEITEGYILENLSKSLKNGVCLIIEEPNSTQIIAEIHCYKLEPKVFNHILSDLTIVVNHEYQGQGLGKLIFNSLLEIVEEERTDILRIELISRESNAKAIAFYQKLGFKQEGRFEKRISNENGSFEADIPMAWFNKNFKNS